MGATVHVVAVPSELSPEPVATFPRYTGALYRLANWLVASGVTTVAMESTGIDWMPVFARLEAYGLDVLLVHARHVKHVPGRQTNVNAAQWLQQLHSYGCLRGRFHPAQEWSALRVSLRHRERVVEYAAAHIQPMQQNTRSAHAWHHSTDACAAMGPDRQYCLCFRATAH